MKDVETYPEPKRLVKKVEWVKAHRTLTGVESPTARVHILGNCAADEAAKQAVSLHPKFPADLEGDIEFWSKRAPLVAKAVGAALAMFPPVHERMQRGVRTGNGNEMIKRRPHSWRFSQGTWRCTTCATWVAAHRLPGERRRGHCEGPCDDERLQKFGGLGHRLCRTQGGTPVIFCVKCGAWSSRRPRKLRQKCTTPTAPGRQALARIARGLAPWQKKGRIGIVEARDTLGTTEAYDGASSQWKACTGQGTKRKIGALATHDVDERAGIQVDDIEAETPPETENLSPMQHDQLAPCGAADAPPAGADQMHWYLDEWPADDYMHYDADEEAARMMGNAGGLDEADARGLSRGSAGASSHQFSAVAAKSGEPSARAGEDTAIASTPTQRAIEYLYKDLKQGPRDGAARLEALRARVKKRIHAQQDNEVLQDVLIADADASTELNEQIKRPRTDEDRNVIVEGEGGSSSGSRGGRSAALHVTGAEPTPLHPRQRQLGDGDGDARVRGHALAAAMGDKRAIGDCAESHTRKRMKAHGSEGVRPMSLASAQAGSALAASPPTRPASQATSTGGERRHRDGDQLLPPAEIRKSRRVENLDSPIRVNPVPSDAQSSADGHARHPSDQEGTDSSDAGRAAATRAQGGTHQWLGRPPADGIGYNPKLQSDR